jgi:TatD DNase family protein
MRLSENTYVNIHAHRKSDLPEEWVLTNMMIEDYPPEGDPDVFYSVGLHPWNILRSDLSLSLKRLQLATENCQVLAIGETGLDRVITTSLKLQLKVFEAQVGLAELADLPVIIHAVKSSQEMIAFFKEYKPAVPMIIHGYRGSLQLAEDLIKAGFYLSFGESLMSIEKVREVFKVLPLEKLFLETDESTESIITIYKSAAALKEEPLEKLRSHMQVKVQEFFAR